MREAGGTHWDNPGGVDLRRPRHITLPARRNTLSPDLDPATPTLFYHQETALLSSLGPDAAGNLYLAVNDSIYTLDSERTTLTRRYQQGGAVMRFGRIVESVTSTGTRFLLATGTSGVGGHEYVRSLNGVAWTASSALPATPNASMQLSDALVWDGLVIAHGEGDQIFASVDGIAWQVDTAGALDEHWRTGDQAIGFVGVAMAPWGASAAYFISGNKLWVLDWYVYNAIEIEDVGDQNRLLLGTVWGGSIIVSDGWTVWEYNPGNAQTVRVIGVFGKDGPPTSWMEDTGHPGTPNNYQIAQFIPGTSDLFAVCRSLASPQSWRLAVYNGVGWSWYGPEVTSSQPYSGTIDLFPLSASLLATTRAIDMAALDSQQGTDFTLHTYYLPTSGDTPVVGAAQRFADGPLAFETGWFDGGFAELEGALFRTAIDGYNLSATETVRVEYRLNNDEQADWLDLGTFTLNQQEIWFDDDHQGVAFKTVQFRITLDRGIGVRFADSGTNLNEDLDLVETGVDVVDSALFRIGDVIRIDSEQMLVTAITPGTNTLTVTRNYNGTVAAVHANGTDVYLETGLTPILKALILLFDKKPRMRTAWTIQVDVARTVERGIRVAGEVATTERVWQFLKSLVNHPTLIRLEVPSLESGGVNVRITDMPGTIQDIRPARGGRGIIDLQAIEPAAE